MKSRRTGNDQSLSEMHLECLITGSYFWYRAEGEDEHLVSFLNRSRYQHLVKRFHSLGIPPPTPEQIHEYALSKWPKHKVHDSTNDHQTNPKRGVM